MTMDVYLMLTGQTFALNQDSYTERNTWSRNPAKTRLVVHAAYRPVGSLANNEGHWYAGCTTQSRNPAKTRRSGTCGVPHKAAIVPRSG